MRFVVSEVVEEAGEYVNCQKQQNVSRLLAGRSAVGLDRSLDVSNNLGVAFEGDVFLDEGEGGNRLWFAKVPLGI